MKYCQQCGTQLSDDSKFCTNCGTFTQQPIYTSQDTIITKLSTRLKTNGIIWIVIAGLQTLLGVFGVWSALIVGVLNIISGIRDIKDSKRILTNPNGIVKSFEPLTSSIITLIYNLVVGGIIGVLGSVYYLVFVRGFVMENKNQFLSLETTNPTYSPPRTPSPKVTNPIATYSQAVTLSHDEAANGVYKEVFINVLQKNVRIHFPANTHDGSSLCLKDLDITSSNGQKQKTEVYIQVSVQKATNSTTYSTANMPSDDVQPSAPILRNETSQDNNATYTLTINRENQWFAVNPAIKVVVDNASEFEIENGATLMIPVTPGPHSIAFSCGFRKKLVSITVTSNVTLTVKWNRATGNIEVA